MTLQSTVAFKTVSDNFHVEVPAAVFRSGMAYVQMTLVFDQ
tara:strand:- start:224 stop:346 length:123 start_codon:yes stop_codon:yes gene_type:complete